MKLKERNEQLINNVHRTHESLDDGSEQSCQHDVELDRLKCLPLISLALFQHL